MLKYFVATLRDHRGFEQPAGARRHDGYSSTDGMPDAETHPDPVVRQAAALLADNPAADTVYGYVDGPSGGRYALLDKRGVGLGQVVVKA